MMIDRAVLLYGSFARGDQDLLSDVDVLIVGPVISEAWEAQLDRDWEERSVHVSRYSWEEFERMHSSGSLFLEHLATEAVPLQYDGDGRSRLESLLSSREAYTSAKDDVRAFRFALSDARNGLAIGVSPVFEVATLGGVARHASVVACYLAGQPTFGRQSIEVGAKLLGVSHLARSLGLAHQFRLFEEGQCSQPVPIDVRGAFNVAAALSEFLNRLEDLAYAQLP